MPKDDEFILRLLNYSHLMRRMGFGATADGLEEMISDAEAAEVLVPDQRAREKTVHSPDERILRQA